MGRLSLQVLHCLRPHWTTPKLLLNRPILQMPDRVPNLLQNVRENTKTLEIGCGNGGVTRGERV